MEKGGKNRINKKLIIGICAIIFIIVSFFIYKYFFYNHFYSLELELGNPLPTLKYFVKNENEIEDCELLTDLNSIDVNVEGKYDVYLKYKDRTQKVTLEIKDTTSPIVILKNYVASKNYQFNVNDFIEEISDNSETSITHSFDTDTILDYEDYSFFITVTDKYGNVTKKETLLSIVPIVNNYNLEYGDKMEISDIVTDEQFNRLIDLDLIEKINQGKVYDEYTIKINVDSKDFECLIKIVDTKAPELVLRDIKAYVDDKPNYEMNDFVISCTDQSEIESISLLNEIDNNTIGTQEISIKATDIYGNEVVKTCIYQIKADDEGPLISGLDDVVLQKNSTYNFNEGVNAYDEGDKENVDFECDDSSLDYTKAGDYFVVYSAIDKSGNTTKAYRKVTINPDQEDEDRLFGEFYDAYLKNKTVEEMARIIQEEIKYNNDYGGDYPVYYGITLLKGNCYVHAMVLKKACDVSNIENMLIHNKSESHFWNLAKVNNIWRHYESTPGWSNNGPMTDKERRNVESIHGDSVSWDVSVYPECN